MERLRVCCGVLVLVACLTWAGVASATGPNYAAGEWGDFGTLQGWNRNATSSVDDDFPTIPPNDPLGEPDYDTQWVSKVSMRFQAYQSATIDQLSLRLVSWLAAEARYGIQGEDGTGKPDGTWIATGTAVPTGLAKYDLATDAVLTKDTTYHVVVYKEPGTSGGICKVYYSSDPGPHRRPIDMRIDDTFNVLVYNQWTSAWEVKVKGPTGSGDPDKEYNPLFGAWNDGVGVPIGGNTYEFVTNPGVYTRGNAYSGGTTFTLTDQEVATNNPVQLSEIKMKIMTAGSPTENLLIKIRRDDGTVLATAVCTPAEADNTVRSFALDSPILVQQGTKYAITTEFAGPQANTQYYRMAWDRANTLAGAADSYLGIEYEAIKTSAGTSGSWYDGGAFSYRSYNASQASDMKFGFDGRVVIPGDATLDWKVGVGDLGLLGAGYDQGPGYTWLTGDFTGDGEVKIGDLGILGAWYGTDMSGGGAPPVPEPMTLSFLALGGLAILRRRRR